MGYYSYRWFKSSDQNRRYWTFDRVMDINLKLSSENDKEYLYEMILTLIRELTKKWCRDIVFNKWW